MENGDIQEFDGSYIEYNFELLATKIDMEEAAAEEQAEIDRQTKILDKARLKATLIDNASLGKAVHARQTLGGSVEGKKNEITFC